MKKLLICLAVATSIVGFIPLAQAQTLLNGDFEKTSSSFGTDQINLSNVAFNGLMTNTFAYGTYGDMDIINSATYSGAAQNGSWFVAFTGGGTDAISMELSWELVVGKNYTITFWDKACASFAPQPFQIGVSMAKDTFGTAVYTAEMPVVGIWTQRSFSFVAPLKAKYITVQLAGEYDIMKWAQADNFTITSGNNTIKTGVLAQNTFCACNTMQIPFTATGIYSPDNTFIAQLSDASGNFTHPQNIGELKTASTTDTIAATIPCQIESSANYRVRVVSSTPNVVGSDNGNNIKINVPITATLGIKAFPSSVIKKGTSVTFRYETDMSKSTIAKYTWQVNEVDAGSLQTFSSDSLNDEDVVTLTITYDDACALSASLVSNQITMTVIAPLEPSVKIEALSPTNIDKGKSVTFAAYPQNAGSNPYYQWKVNGKNAGGNSSLFFARKLQDGDEITVEMTTNHKESGIMTMVSNAMIVTVDSPLVVDKLIKAKAKKAKDKKSVGVVRFKSSSINRKGFGKRFLKKRSLVGMHH
ncbi:MAG: hypothetical protein WCQ95_10770 [Bacteroidota bacterium]